MAYRGCPRCGQFDKDSVAVCTKCGFDWNQPQEKQMDGYQLHGTRYCRSCNKSVVPKVHYGIGTLILVVCTCGVGLIFLPFYKPSCPICHGQAWGQMPQKEKPSAADELKKLQELKQSGTITDDEFLQMKSRIMA